MVIHKVIELVVHIAVSTFRSLLSICDTYLVANLEVNRLATLGIGCRRACRCCIKRRHCHILRTHGSNGIRECLQGGIVRKVYRRRAYLFPGVCRHLLFLDSLCGSNSDKFILRILLLGIGRRHKVNLVHRACGSRRKLGDGNHRPLQWVDFFRLELLQRSFQPRHINYFVFVTLGALHLQAVVNFICHKYMLLLR